MEIVEAKEEKKQPFLHSSGGHTNIGRSLLETRRTDCARDIIASLSRDHTQKKTATKNK